MDRTSEQLRAGVADLAQHAQGLNDLLRDALELLTRATHPVDDGCAICQERRTIVDRWRGLHAKKG